MKIDAMKVSESQKGWRRLFCVMKGNEMMKKHENLQKTVFAAMFLALAFVLPFLTGQIREIGSMLCPMHVPVLLCGFILGPLWGGAVGFSAPLLRSVTLGMPMLFPAAVCMAFELATYGAVAGLAYRLLRGKKFCTYSALFAAMGTGRLVWGLAMLLCMGLRGSRFTFSAFLAGAFTNAIPGIIVQIVLIPILVKICERFSRT